MTPTISVIIPCYKQSQYLAEALDSVLAQTYKEWECIIINDNSPDETEQVAEKYIRFDSRYKYLFTDNKGVSVARNEGIKAASGMYILPLDADDKIAPTYLEKAIAAFSNDPELTLVYGEAEFFGDVVGRWKLPDYSYYDLLFMNMIYCSAIFKKVDFLNAGGYSGEMLHGHEDWDLWLRLLNENSKVLMLPEIVFYYRKKGASRTSDLHNNRIEETQKLLLKRNKEVYYNYLYNILNELEQCKVSYKELQRQLELLRNSRIQKLVSFWKNIIK